MEELFKVGNIITTNEMNGFKILGVNETDICVQNLLTLDFEVFNKTHHRYTLFNPKTVLKNELKSILDDIEISEKDKGFILEQMNCRIDKFIIT
jgi:hypothetical protein